MVDGFVTMEVGDLTCAYDECFAVNGNACYFQDDLSFILKYFTCIGPSWTSRSSTTIITEDFRLGNRFAVFPGSFSFTGSLTILGNAYLGNVNFVVATDLTITTGASLTFDSDDHALALSVKRSTF
jgi:hypothetical protein